MSELRIMLLPADLVRLPDGTEAMVSSSHYIDSTGRRMFSIFPQEGLKKFPDRLYYHDECQLLHRHDYKPYHGIRRCDCGAIYTTMADEMMPYKPVTWQ